ncbi:regulatory protein ArsR [Thermodesulfobium narugense DSM 14796]|uniref:Regulatory protein ArsR n=1 Tax=Thermodesulfobium narugense DSM 14796 TaxID=747365 RepID=M1E6D1_9BACT|nr:metalloregulator ArsR/SmtB family transcription factor [Thermodesulfobium narugense]AEE14108.1 regulatory protein ArsR [Thermodesulfobium narugense DSM 14796]
MLQLFEAHAELCKSLSNPKRLMIIAMLAEGEANVTEIAKTIDARPSTVSQHLALLRAHNLVETRKEGKTIYYSLSDKRLGEACNLIRQILYETMKKKGNFAKEMSLESNLLCFKIKN